MNLTIDGVPVTLDTVGNYEKDISPLVQELDRLAGQNFAGLGKEGMTSGMSKVVITTDRARFTELTDNPLSGENDGMTSNRGNTVYIWVNGEKPSNLNGSLIHELQHAFSNDVVGETKVPHAPEFWLRTEEIAKELGRYIQPGWGRSLKTAVPRRLSNRSVGTV